MLRPSIRGFTIVELLVVVAIIGVLATVILANLNQGRERAAAANELRQLQEIEKALRVYLIDNGYAQWWEQGDSSGVHMSTINEIRNDSDAPGFDQYISELPKSYLNSDFDYQYRNSGDPLQTPCGDRRRGVSIRIDQAHSANPEAVLEIDQELDGGDGMDCGRFRWSDDASQSIYYIIANDSDDL